MADNNSGSFLGGLLLGTAVGAITGLLIAPRTGRETRQFLRKSADALPELVEDLASTVQLQADRLSEGTLSQWEQTLERLREAISAGQAATQEEYASLKRGKDGQPMPVTHED
ncbi:MAG: YtxH domain-containing protein [Cyanobacteria bacterium]|nr:YtxH domain-containing protein [Cyanobacteriota bacterium]MDA0865916.1 YtxH domain-containing protein [Cyanobacteriota bacterium]